MISHWPGQQTAEACSLILSCFLNYTRGRLNELSFPSGCLHESCHLRSLRACDEALPPTLARQSQVGLDVSSHRRQLLTSNLRILRPGSQSWEEMMARQCGTDREVSGRTDRGTQLGVGSSSLYFWLHQSTTNQFLSTWENHLISLGLLSLSYEAVRPERLSLPALVISNFMKQLNFLNYSTWQCQVHFARIVQNSQHHNGRRDLRGLINS